MVRIIFLLLFTFLSCERKNNHLEENIVITIKMKVIHDDVFQLFFSDSYVNNYQERESISLKVLGKDAYQHVVFKLSKGILPKRIRVDLGNNINQKEIQIDYVSIGIKNKIIFFNKDNFNRMFEFNECVQYIKHKKTILLDCPNEFYDPYFISKNLAPIIKQLSN